MKTFDYLEKWLTIIKTCCETVNILKLNEVKGLYSVSGEYFENWLYSSIEHVMNFRNCFEGSLWLLFVLHLLITMFKMRLILSIVHSLYIYTTTNISQRMIHTQPYISSRWITCNKQNRNENCHRYHQIINIISPTSLNMNHSAITVT